MSDDAAPIRSAPIALWRVAQAFLLTLGALFGAPEDVARRHTLTAQAHAFMAGWLRCGEALMRRLLACEAAAYAQPNTRPLLQARRKRQPKLMGFDAEHPEKWRVSFRCFHSPTLRQAQGGAGGNESASLSLSKAARLPRKDRWHQMHWKPVTFRSAWPLAERYEALIRVFNDPGAYARRLARRLHAAPHRVREALRAPPEAIHRVDAFEQLGERVRAAWRFNSA